MRERTPAWITKVQRIGSAFNSLFLCSSSFLHDIPVYLKQDTCVSLVSYTESNFFRNLRLCIRWKLMLCTVGEDCHIRKVMEGKRGGVCEKFSSNRERVEYNWMFIMLPCISPCSSYVLPFVTFAKSFAYPHPLLLRLPPYRQLDVFYTPMCGF